MDGKVTQLLWAASPSSFPKQTRMVRQGLKRRGEKKKKKKKKGEHREKRLVGKKKVGPGPPVMPNKCCVPGCRSNYDSNKDVDGFVSVFKFPSEPAEKELWLRNVGLTGPVAKSAMVCEKHFRPDLVSREDRAIRPETGEILTCPRERPKLLPGAIPTIFVNANSSVKGKGSEKRSKTKKHAAERREEEEVEGECEEDDFIDEEQEAEFDENEERRAKGVPGRTVTLQMLLAADILAPGEANMSIEYMGQRFIGDLLSDGKIKSLETDIIFASPSAWASHCKRMVNPDKKSGCGWASVKYQGQKLDFFKNKYFKMLQKDNEQSEEAAAMEEESEQKSTATTTTTATTTSCSTSTNQESQVGPLVRLVVKHATLGFRSTVHDGNTLVEAMPFSALGKIQPFLVSISSNAALVLDFHCHLTTSEVVGYLAGHWDVNAHNLAITHAFPCRSRLNDRELGPLVEEDISRGIEARRLSLVGWYHSHPTAPAAPTLRDIDAQLDYEIKMKGTSDATYTPVVGLISCPYHPDAVSLESSLLAYWVVPPPENKPHEYGKPMIMNYSMIHDQFLSQDALNEMKKCAEFYKGDQDFINFQGNFKGNVTYLDKLKSSVTAKFPRDQSDGLLWNLLAQLVCPGLLPEPITHFPSVSTPTTSLSTTASSSTSTVPLISTASVSVSTSHHLSSGLPLSTSATLMPITVPKAGSSSSSSSSSTSTHQQAPPPPPPPYLGAELASALLAAGKFPPSLVGLFPPFPHPLSLSTAAAAAAAAAAAVSAGGSSRSAGSSTSAGRYSDHDISVTQS